MHLLNHNFPLNFVRILKMHSHRECLGFQCIFVTPLFTQTFISRIIDPYVIPTIEGTNQAWRPAQEEDPLSSTVAQHRLGSSSYSGELTSHLKMLYAGTNYASDLHPNRWSESYRWEEVGFPWVSMWPSSEEPGMRNSGWWGVSRAAPSHCF